MIMWNHNQNLVNHKALFSFKENALFPLIDEASLTSAPLLDLRIFVLGSGDMTHDPMQKYEQVQYEFWPTKIILKL